MYQKIRTGSICSLLSCALPILFMRQAEAAQPTIESARSQGNNISGLRIHQVDLTKGEKKNQSNAPILGTETGITSAERKEVKRAPKKSRRCRVTEFAFVGNSVSLKFHNGSCEFAMAMRRNRRQTFQSREEAELAGMRPCNWCFPPFWTEVKGQLISPTTDELR